MVKRSSDVGHLSKEGGIAQTMEMGPGAHHDTLNDVCGWSNRHKMVDIGMCNVVIDPHLFTYTIPPSNGVSYSYPRILVESPSNIRTE